MGQSKPFYDSFDQQQIGMIAPAIERAWCVIRLDDVGKEDEALTLLALCVLNEARSGEDNHIKLVNMAINRFRVQRATLISENHRLG